MTTKRKRVVTIGGGTGSFMLLSGLKKYPIDITAIVSMADDGGSTGVLRDELGVLPPGDVRQCLVALSESSNTMRQLLNYRFEGGGLKGHSFGNLLLSALEKISGGFGKGVDEALKILNVKGNVVPVSEDDMRLRITLKDGEILLGQSQLDHNEDVRKIGIGTVTLQAKVKAYKKALEEIAKADAIIIGPGDLYGSIVPNLLVPEICAAIKNAKGLVVFNCNLTNKKGQTDNFTLEDYAGVIEGYIGKGRIDYVVFNKKKISPALVRKYEKREGRGMIVTCGHKKDRCTYRTVMANVLGTAEIKGNANDAMDLTRSFIRHDSEKLAKVLMMIMELSDYENIIKEII